MKSSRAQGARVDPADYPRFNLQPITSTDLPNRHLPDRLLGLKASIVSAFAIAELLRENAIGIIDPHHDAILVARDVEDSAAVVAAD